MSIGPDDYIDLDEEHEPMPVRLSTGGFAEIPQTKRDWCAQLAIWAGGLEKVDDAMLERHRLTRAEYNEFCMDRADADRQIRERRDSDAIFYNPEEAEEPEV